MEEFVNAKFEKSKGEHHKCNTVKKTPLYAPEPVFQDF